MNLWNWRDLFTDHRTGKLREAVIWAHVCKAAMTFGFIWTVIHGHSSEWLWLTFGAVCLGHEGFTRVLNQKQQQIDKEPTP